MNEISADNLANKLEFLTVSIQDSLFGISVKKIKDVFHSQHFLQVPHASADIIGVMNLRGNIITAIDLRKRLGIFDDSSNEPPQKSINVVVEFGDELYSLRVDSVGEVLSLSQEEIEQSPSILEQRWQDFTSGVYKLPHQLLIILNLDNVLGIGKQR